MPKTDRYTINLKKSVANDFAMKTTTARIFIEGMDLDINVGACSSITHLLNQKKTRPIAIRAFEIANQNTKQKEISNETIKLPDISDQIVTDTIRLALDSIFLNWRNDPGIATLDSTPRVRIIAKLLLKKTNNNVGIAVQNLSSILGPAVRTILFNVDNPNRVSTLGRMSEDNDRINTEDLPNLKTGDKPIRVNTIPDEEFERNILTYYSLLDDAAWVKRHEGEYVAIDEGRVIGTSYNKQLLVSYATPRSDGLILVKKIGEKQERDNAPQLSVY